jgi:hypothetical protein
MCDQPLQRNARIVGASCHPGWMAPTREADTFALEKWGAREEIKKPGLFRAGFDRERDDSRFRWDLFSPEGFRWLPL